MTRGKPKARSRGMTTAQRALFEANEYVGFVAAIRADPRTSVSPGNPSFWCEGCRSSHPDTTPCADGRLKCFEDPEDRR
jgi:hypothetical protein